LDATYNCFRDSKFSRINRILPSIHKGFLQNSQVNDEAAREECQASFEELRKRLTSTLVLVLLDLTKKFDIYFDASR
jgi:hypothetical protein